MEHLPADLGASFAVVGLTWVLFSAPLLLSFLGGRLADRHSRFALMVAGFPVQAVCWLLVPIFHDPTVFLLLLPIDGLAFAFAFPAKQAFLVQVSPQRWLGTVQGMEQAGMQFAALIGTVAAPLLYAWLGARLLRRGRHRGARRPDRRHPGAQADLANAEGHRIRSPCVVPRAESPLDG